MKKSIILMIAVCMLCMFAGCGSSDTTAENSEVDVDLTGMSSTMVFSEVADMVSNPDAYDGQIVKMKGIAASYYDQETGETYYACIVQDATACCAQGLEYILVTPDAYPEDKKEITVLGTFQKYIIDGQYAYGRIVDAKVL